MNALSQVKVWLVSESVRMSTDPTQDWPRQERDLFILATSLAEALEVVGSAPKHEVVQIREVCPITIVPNGKWRVVPMGTINP